MRGRRLSAGYLILQATAGGLWWASLFVWPESRRFYWPAGWPEAGLLAFWLPDLLLFVGGSAVSAWLVVRGSPRRRVVLWLTCGAALYAALFCVSLWLLTGQAAWSAAAMAPSAALTLLVALAERG